MTTQGWAQRSSLDGGGRDWSKAKECPGPPEATKSPEEAQKDSSLDVQREHVPADALMSAL